MRAIGRRTGRSAVVAMLAVAIVIVLAMGSGSLASALAAGATVAGPADVVASSQLTAIACPTSTACFAVGFSSDSSSGMDKTLIERWDGAHWSVVASPNPAGAKFARLFAVGCQGASSCFAVGNQFFPASKSGKTLIERWNGKTWSIVAGPNSAAGWSDPQLNGVSCTATTCLAVGEELITSASCCKAVVQRWDGKAWSSVPTPKLAGSSYSRLDGVSCTTTLVCVAVGMSSANRPKTLVERWNGKSMSFVASPSHPVLGAGDSLASVSCPSVTSCVAAGNYLIGDVGRPATLVEGWNGAKWSMVTSADPQRSYAELHGISCATTTSCMAAGESFAPTAPPPYGFVGSKPLLERWNGKAWSLMTTPRAGTYTSLAAVKCVNGTTCYAVGHGSGASGASNALIERWDGKTWKVMVNANP